MMVMLLIKNCSPNAKKFMLMAKVSLQKNPGSEEIRENIQLGIRPGMRSVPGVIFKIELSL
jgi:hypothetical protein